MLKSIELPQSPSSASPRAPSDNQSLADRLASLLESPDLDAELDRDVGLEERLVHLARDLGAARTARAYD